MRRGWLAAVLTVLVLAAGCREPQEHVSVIQLAERAQAPNSNGGASSERYLEGAVLTEVPGDAERPAFRVLSRTAELRKFPCSQCHSVPVASMRGSGSVKRAHWDVHLVHAPPDVMRCTTCHAAAGLDTLTLLQGQAVAFDRADRVCAQCHARQAADWAGGAHGKRVGGWAPPRVVLSCPACHDPHRPAWDTRWPVVTGRSAR